MAEIMNGASADATIQGTVGTHTTGVVDGATKVTGTPEINKATTSQKLAKIGWSNAPLDTFLRNIGKGKTNSDTYQFFSVTARGVACTASAAEEKGDVIEVTLATGVHSLSKSGVLMVPTLKVENGVAASAGAKPSLKPLMLHIADIDYSGKKVSLVPLNGTVEASLLANVTFYRAGIACDQDVAITEDPQAMPTKDHNHCQRMLCTISENMYQALQDKEVEYGLNDYRDQALLDFRLQSEMAAIFGGGAVAGENFIDPKSNKRKLHMRGVLDFDIQNIMKTEADEGVDAFLNRAMEELFAVNNGSSERLLLYGAGFATALANSKWWQKQLEANKTEMKWGVTWKMVESNFGSLRGIMDPALSLTGEYSNCALVIDPAHVRLVEQVPLQERKLDLVSAGIRNSKDIVLEESITLELTNPKAHGLLVL